MGELPEAMVDRVARAIIRTSRNYDIYHMPGDEPRQWRSSGGGIFQTTPLPAASADKVRATARAALEAAGVGDLLEALRLMRAEGPSRFSEGTWLAAERAVARAEGRHD